MTVAEIFILLLFLLLLVFLSLNKGREQKEEQLAVVQQWGEVIEKFETPEEVETLALQREKARREAEQYREQLSELKEVLQKDDNQLREENSELQEQIEDLQRDAQGAQQQNEQLKEELRIVREKGTDPPCWYKVVPDPKKGEREKPLYSFHIAVFEETMIVRQAPTPPGGATDDGGLSYASEAGELGFAGIPYDQPLSDEELIKHMKPVHDAGKNGEVRTYSCLFFAKVWDKTPPHAKKRWKQAHDGVLEGLFGTYTVQDEIWPPST